VNALRSISTLAVALAAAAGLALPAIASDVEAFRNQCRAACGAAWVRDRACAADPRAYNPPSPARCRKTAQRTYAACLSTCVDAVPPPPAPEGGWAASTPAAPWADAPLNWRSLPSQAPAELPHAFAIPSAAWEYAASGGPIVVPLAPALAAGEAAYLRVDVEVTGGPAGLSIASADGAKILSREKIVMPDTGRATVYFRLDAAYEGAIVLVRNPGKKAQPGAVAITATRWARAANLSAEELAAAAR